MDVHAGYIRGNTLQVGFTFKGGFKDRDPFKIKNDPPNLISDQRSVATKIVTSRDERSLYLLTLSELRKNEIYLQSAEINEKDIHIIYSQSKFNNTLQAAGRTALVINKLARDTIDTFKLSSLNGPNVMNSVSIPRDELKGTIPGKDFQSLGYVSQINKDDLMPDDMEYVPKAVFPYINYGFTPALRTHIGGPDGFFFGQGYLRGDLDIAFSRNFSLTSILSLNIFDNFENLKLPSDSVLPKVRTEIVDYLKDGSDISFPRMQFNYIDNLTRDLYTRFSFGLFEEMYGALGLNLYTDLLLHLLHWELRCMMLKKETLIKNFILRIIMW